MASVLDADPAFDVVSVTASREDARPAADVVLVARGPGGGGAMARDESASDPALTNREGQILALLADGLGNKQIAARLRISSNTVKTHLELLFEKLGVASRAEAVAVAVRRGLLLL